MNRGGINEAPLQAAKSQRNKRQKKRAGAPSGAVAGAWLRGSCEFPRFFKCYATQHFQFF